MFFPKQLIKYGLLFFFLPILLQVFGFIQVSLDSIFSFAAFFIGLTVFYYSFGTNNFLSIFFGSGLFLAGLLSFLIKSFLLEITFALILAGSFYITGFSFLMVFVENTKRKSALYAAGVLIISASVVSLSAGNLRLTNFFSSIPEVFKTYWLLLAAAVVTVLLFYFEQKHSRK